jgi:hypothetical protein
MNTEQIIEVIKATSGTLDSLISQFAYFFAIQAASKWLAVTLPLLIVFGIMLRIAATFKAEGSSHQTVGSIVLVAWMLFAVTLYTGVRGVSHILQAAMAPSIYVASEMGDLSQVLKLITKKE